MKNIDDPRASRSRSALLNSATELFLLNPTAAMTEVATHAGVGRATLYRHFETREQLVLALAKDSLEITDQVLQPLREQKMSAKQTLIEGLRVVMPIADKYHFLLQLWTIGQEDPEVDEIYNRQLDELAALVERGKTERSISSEISTSWIVMLYDSLLYIGWWSIQSGDMDAELATNHAIESLFKGIAR